MQITPNDIIRFWFDELSENDWWQGSEALDTLCRTRFSAVLDAASAGELWHWRKHMDGRLAEIIVLDQFSRMIHRDTSRAFAQDAMALTLSQEAVRIGGFDGWPFQRRLFLIMPYMHSESRVVHAEAVRLFEAQGLAHHLDFELQHKAIIDRFGRYPHRNATVGRDSSAEEIAFLEEPNSSF